MQCRAIVFTILTYNYAAYCYSQYFSHLTQLKYADSMEKQQYTLYPRVLILENGTVSFIDRYTGSE